MPDRGAIMPVRRARRRRWMRPLAWLVLLLVLLFCLVWWFPARWAWALARSSLPQVKLTEPSGTFWNGHADALAIRGQPLGVLDWHIGHGLLLNDLEGRVRLRAPHWSGSGHFRRSGAHQLDLDHVHATLPAALLGTPAWLDGLQPGGTLRVDVSHLRLRSNWPVQCTGVVHWQGATLSDARTTAGLGDLLARAGMQAGTTLRATLRDSGSGPLALHGGATITPLGWRLQLTMRPRGRHPALYRMLTRLGRTGADGAIVVRRQAGLFSGRSR